MIEARIPATALKGFSNILGRSWQLQLWYQNVGEIIRVVGRVSSRLSLEMAERDPSSFMLEAEAAGIAEMRVN